MIQGEAAWIVSVLASLFAISAVLVGIGSMRLVHLWIKRQSAPLEKSS